MRNSHRASHSSRHKTHHTRPGPLGRLAYMDEVMRERERASVFISSEGLGNSFCGMNGSGLSQ